MLRRLFVGSLVGAAARPARAQVKVFGLRFDRLTAGFAPLSDGDRRRIDQSIGLIRKGQHLAALAPLTEMAKMNPGNASIRVLLSYVLLQAGNLAGAFDHATFAEREGRNHYFCLFLARVALLTGNLEACRRELDHAQGDRRLAKEVDQVRKQLTTIRTR